MSLTVELSGVNVNHKLKNNTLRINRGITTKNSLSATFIKQNVQVGQEIVIKDRTTTLFGGLIQNISRRYISPTETEVTVSATGYEQVCSRRTFGGSFKNKYAGEIIITLLTNWLSPTSDYSEGFTEGVIENGIFLATYVMRAKNFKTVLDDLSEASGFKWWVDDDKKLYFKRTAEVSDSGYKITMNPLEANRLTDVRDLQVEETLAGYRNNQFVVGAVGETEYVLSSSENVSEINRMKGLYGSGVYGQVTVNKNLTSDIEAKNVADNLLDTYARIPRTVSFSTTKPMEVAKTLLIHVNSINITDPTKFLISEISIFQRDKEIIYSCSCDYYHDVNEEEAKLKDDWTDGFATFNNKNNEDPNAVYFATNIVLQWLEVKYTNDKIVVEFDVPYTEPPTISVSFLYDKKASNDGTRTVTKYDFHYGIDHIITSEAGGNLKYTGVTLEVGGASLPTSISEGYFTVYAIGRFK